MNRPILLFPTGSDNHNRMTFAGLKFASFDELRTYQGNAKYTDAQVISNGTLYEYEDIEQAIADVEPEKVAAADHK